MRVIRDVRGRQSSSEIGTAQKRKQVDKTERNLRSRLAQEKDTTGTELNQMLPSNYETFR